MKNLLIGFTLIVYLILVIILVINLKKNNRIIKFVFLLFFLAMIIMINVYDSSIIDFLIGQILRYIYFPSFYAYILTIIVSFFMLIYTVYDGYMNDKIRIINYIFGSLITLSYVVFLLQKVDTTSVGELYNGNALLCLRYVTRSFLIWLVIMWTWRYNKIFDVG